MYNKGDKFLILDRNLDFNWENIQKKALFFHYICN